MPFYTYILYSFKLDRYYVGSCEEPEARMRRHNQHSTRSTSPGVPWVLIYTETFNTRDEAISREFEIKRKKSRKYIEYLITSSGNLLPNPQI